MDNVISRLANDPNVHEIVSYANTPQYLLRRLRASSAVHALVDLFDGNELYERLRDMASKQVAGSELEQAIEEYLLLAALSINPVENLSEKLYALDLGHLHWANHIIGMISDEYSPTNTVESEVTQ